MLGQQYTSHEQRPNQIIQYWKSTIFQGFPSSQWLPTIPLSTKRNSQWTYNTLHKCQQQIFYEWKQNYLKSREIPWNDFNRYYAIDSREYEQYNKQRCWKQRGQRVVEGVVSFSLKMQFWFGNEQKYEIYLFYVIEILYIFQEW